MSAILYGLKYAFYLAAFLTVAAVLVFSFMMLIKGLLKLVMRGVDTLKETWHEFSIWTKRTFRWKKKDNQK